MNGMYILVSWLNIEVFLCIFYYYTVENFNVPVQNMKVTIWIAVTVHTEKNLVFIEWSAVPFFQLKMYTFGSEYKAASNGK